MKLSHLKHTYNLVVSGIFRVAEVSLELNFRIPTQSIICFLSLWIWLFWTFHISRITQYVVFCDWLLNTLFSRFIHCGMCEYLLHKSSWLNNIPLYRLLHFIYPPISWWTCGLFPLIMNNTTMSIHVHIFMWTHVLSSFGYILRSRIVGSYCNSVWLWETARLFFLSLNTLSWAQICC